MKICNSQPTTAMAGVTMSKPRNGEMPNWSASTNRANAASTARLPCARLMMRITENMNDRPAAISA